MLLALCSPERSHEIELRRSGGTVYCAARAVGGRSTPSSSAIVANAIVIRGFMSLSS
jgi:hypothetical protein